MLAKLREYLLQEALTHQEGIECDNKALVVTTGKRTGRSPKDRFIVRDNITEHTIDWNDINQPLSTEHFAYLWHKATHHIINKRTYQSHFNAAPHTNHCITIHALTECAWHMLFLTNLLLLSTPDQHTPQWQLLCVPSLKLDPSIDPSHSDGIVAIDMIGQKILIIGIEYAGEIKKSIFSVMNYLLPEKNILSMHCAANAGEDHKVSLFFGLSGTGKTTLSADSTRFLIGDDEHGWGDDIIFNIENGCYAKCFGLHYTTEPVIFDAIRQYTILENVVLNDQLQPQYNDASLTLNTRAAYPIDYITPRTSQPIGNTPSFIFMLSCDLFGVLPALSKLTIDQAIFWFLTGYTAHMGSTEYKESGIKPTFSTCFGAPFFPRNPEIYASMLEDKLQDDIDVYLVNTGYYGGTFKNNGKRYPLHITRELINSIHLGNFIPDDKTEGPFGLIIPEIHLNDFTIQHPMKYWDEPELYINTKNNLQNELLKHFNKLNISQELKKRLLLSGITL